MLPKSHQPPVGQAQFDLLTDLAQPDLLTYSMGASTPKTSVAHQFARKVEKRDFDGQHPGGGAASKAKRRFTLRALPGWSLGATNESKRGGCWCEGPGGAGSG
jgi:hypothetical protein